MYSEEIKQFIEEKRLKYPVSSVCKMLELYYDKKITMKALRKYYYRHNLDYKKDSRGNYDCRNWNCTHAKPIGTESNADKNGLVRVKVTDKQWVYKQRHIYELHNDKIPKGYRVVFLNGDNTDFDVENSTIVKNKDAIVLYSCGMNTKDRETTKLGLQVARLINKTKELEV